MSSRQERALQATRLLAAAGISARVSSAGADGEIAAVQAPASRLQELATYAPSIRALGYRYVALELVQTAPSHSP